MSNTKKRRKIVLAGGFVFFVCTLILFGTGCATKSVICELGTTSTLFYDYRYEMSPDRGEIIFTGRKIKAYNYLPFYGGFHYTPAWFLHSTWEERIPVDPLPDDLSRCAMIVETTPDAPLPTLLTPRTSASLLDLKDHETGYADELFEFRCDSDEFPLRAGETIRLQVRPEFLPNLSRPFRVRLFRRDGAQDGEPESEPYFMFPLGVAGDRYELATDLRPREKGDTPEGRRARINSLYPLREKQQEEILQEYARSYHDELGVQLDGSPTVAAVCWKVLWFPSAVVADTALLPFWIIGFPWASSIATRFYENRGW